MAEPRRQSWRAIVVPNLLPAVLALLLVLVSATCVILVLDRRNEPASAIVMTPANVDARLLKRGASSDDPAAQAVAAGGLAARTYFTLTSATIKADLDAMRALGTDEFVAAYDSTARALARRITKQRVALTASLPRGAVATEYLSADLAQVLVAVDVTRRSAGATSKPMRTVHRTRVSLTRVDGAWLVAAIDEVE